MREAPSMSSIQQPDSRRIVDSLIAKGYSDEDIIEVLKQEKLSNPAKLMGNWTAGDIEVIRAQRSFAANGLHNGARAAEQECSQSRTGLGGAAFNWFARLTPFQAIIGIAAIVIAYSVLWHFVLHDEPRDCWIGQGHYSAGFIRNGLTCQRDGTWK
jgi:hypothetical protein